MDSDSVLVVDEWRKCVKSLHECEQGDIAAAGPSETGGVVGFFCVALA